MLAVGKSIELEFRGLGLKILRISEIRSEMNTTSWTLEY